MAFAHNSKKKKHYGNFHLGPGKRVLRQKLSCRTKKLLHPDEKELYSTFETYVMRMHYVQKRLERVKVLILKIDDATTCQRCE